MSTPNPVLTTIIFVFAVQAIILSGLLVTKRPRAHSNILLALLVFFFALMAFNIALVNVMKSKDLFHVFRYVQMELLYGIGPALYFYTRSITVPEFTFKRKNLLHFVPVIIEFIFYRTPIYRLGADGLYQTPQHPYTPIYQTQQWLGSLSITIYAVLALLILFKHQRWLKDQYSNLESRSLSWLRIPVIVYSLFWISWNILTDIDRIYFERAFKNIYFLPTFVGLAIITCWIGFKGYTRSSVAESKTRKIPPEHEQ